MKFITKAIIVLTSVFALVGCKDDIEDVSSNKQIAQEIQGSVIHTPTFTGVGGGVTKLGEGVYGITLAMVPKGELGTAVTFLCDVPSGEMGIQHNIYNNGRLVRNAVSFSVINYKAGTKQITERDDDLGVVFSTSNDDTDIIGFLTRGLKKLDSDSYVSFVVDTTDDQGNVITAGWSPLVKVKDLTKQVNKMQTNVCKSSRLVLDPEYINAFTNEQAIEMQKNLQ